MDFDNAVLIRSYPDIVTADMAAAALEQQNIESALVVDDAGGALPMMQAVRGVKLFVPAVAEAAARSVLDAIDGAPAIEDVSDPEADDATEG